MNDVLKVVENKFNISSIREAIIGGTMVGLNPAIGTQASGVSIALDNKQRLNLYSELTQLESEENNPFDYMGLSTLWNVGFVSSNEKLTTPDFFGGQTTRYLKSRKLKTVDQLFARRSEGSTQAFFSCFKFNGASETIVPSVIAGNDGDEHKRYGLICEHWITHPQKIKYVASVKGSVAKSRDYLYIIGADQVEFFDPKWVLSTLTKMFKELEAKFEQANKKSIPSDIRDINRILTEETWTPFIVDKHPDSVIKHPMVSLGLDIRLMNRIIGSVFDFYNYLLHAHKHLRLPHLYEVTSDNLGKPVKIEELLKEYEIVYRYCKNISLYQ